MLEHIYLDASKPDMCSLEYILMPVLFTTLHSSHFAACNRMNKRRHLLRDQSLTMQRFNRGRLPVAVSSLASWLSPFPVFLRQTQSGTYECDVADNTQPWNLIWFQCLYAKGGDVGSNSVLANDDLICFDCHRDVCVTEVVYRLSVV